MTSVIVWCSTGSRPTPPGNSVVAARSAHLFDGAVACGPSNPRRQSCCRRVGGQVRRHGLVIVRRHRLKRLRENLSLTIMLSITCLFRRRRRRLRSIAGNLIRAIDGDVTERSTAQFPPPLLGALAVQNWAEKVGCMLAFLRSDDYCDAARLACASLQWILGLSRLQPYPTTISALTIVMHGLQRRAQKRCFNFRQIKLLLLLTLTCC